MLIAMAGRHLKDLIAAYQRGDDLAFRRATQAIIDEEEAKKHTTLARDLRHMLAAGSRQVTVEAHALPEPPRDRDSGISLVDLRPPGAMSFTDMVFPVDLEGSLTALADEVGNWAVLDSAGLPRRNRLLLHGPPGCGKTSIAAALATELGLPLATARIDSLMSSFLGETAANLRLLFDFAAATPCVLLLDEFDSLGKMRADPADHGELRRVVNAVLQLIESYRGSSFVVAATNSPDMLDAALWRRFDEVLEVPLPTSSEIERLLSRRIPELRLTGSLGAAAHRLTGLPHAAAECAIDAVRRRAVLAGRSVEQGDLEEGVRYALGRPWV
jgi:ATPase family associated with various cellular activities (AAA)